MISEKYHNTEGPMTLLLTKVAMNLSKLILQTQLGLSLGSLFRHFPSLMPPPPLVN